MAQLELIYLNLRFSEARVHAVSFPYAQEKNI